MPATDHPVQRTQVQGIPARLAALHFVTGNRQQLLDYIGESIGASMAVRASRPPTAMQALPNRVIGFINPHVYNQAAGEAVVAQFLQRADRVCVDGIGIKLAVALMHRQWLPRVVAEHLFEALVCSQEIQGEAILIGATTEAAALATEAINRTSAGVHIIDYLDGYRQAEDYREFLDTHRHCPLVLVAAGTPRSEQISLMADTCCRGSVIFHIGGGTLNTWAGTKLRGPRWLSTIGMEWLHRIVHEPHTRHRYTAGGIAFVRHLAGHPVRSPQRTEETRS